MVGKMVGGADVAQQPASDPVYALGRSDAETRRLARQQRLLGRQTRFILEQAGIGAGMRVLDVGSGAGDSAFLAAELVGPTGQVVGVDLNPAVVEVARRRAADAGLAQVSFVVGDIREIDPGRDFDAAIGRMVLVYQADPVATLRAALRAVRDDGLAVFYEADMGSPVASLPEVPLHQFLGRCINETFARAGLETAMGTKLHRVFCDAGLAAPEVVTDAMIGGGRAFVEEFAWWGANTLRSLLPLIVKHGVATEGEVDVETFERRYCAGALGRNSLARGHQDSRP